MSIALQDQLPSNAPIRNCYGCGADNSCGLNLKSIIEGEVCTATWTPRNHHCSYPGFLNGGVAATLIDCHSAWAAYAFECRDRGLSVENAGNLAGWTRVMNLEYLKPVPLDAQVQLKAELVKKGTSSRTIQCVLLSGGEEHVRAEVVIVINNA